MQSSGRAEQQRGLAAKAKKKKQRQHLVRAACESCRVQKLSCDGRRPSCGRCVKSGVAPCVYDTQCAEETRSMALRRENGRLRSTLTTIMESFTALKELPAEASLLLLNNVVSAENPVMELMDTGRRIAVQQRMLAQRISALEAAQACFPNTQSSLEFELNLRHPVAFPAFAAAMHSDQLKGWADIPTQVAASVLPSRVPATLPALSDGPLHFLNIQFWTRVSIGDDLAARAISIYLKTDQALLGHFDAELFLDDLLACRTRFCSRLLVNALLFYCCVKITAFERNATSLADMFLLECEEELKVDTKPSALSLSASAFVFAGSINSGRIAEALSYMARAVQIGEDLRVWSSTTNPDRNEWDVDEYRMLSSAAWGFFAHSVFWSFRWWDRAPVAPPNLAIPLDKGLGAVRPSKLFGISADDAVRSEQTFVALCNVLLVIRDAVTEFFRNAYAPERRFSFSFVQTIFRRLLDCNDSDTSRLNPGVDGPDFVTVIRMWFHMAVMDFYQPFLQRKDSLQGFSANHGTARTLYLASLRQLHHLVLTYRLWCPLAMTTPLWHGGIFFLAKAVTIVDPGPESETIFRLCVLMYADLIVAFPGLLDVYRSMMLMGLKAGFMTLEESVSLVRMIEQKRDMRWSSKAVDLESLAALSPDQPWREAAHLPVDILEVT